MCGGDVGKIAGGNLGPLLYPMDPLRGALTGAFIGNDLSGFADSVGSLWDQRNRFTHETGGDRVTDPLGLLEPMRDRYGHQSTRRAQDAADRQAEQQRRYFDNQLKFAPRPPSESASFVNPNAELRDRRRRAVLLGVDQLRTPGSGSGGGGYDGANAPLY